MDLFYFMLRYIPFWAVPVFMITAEFGYIFWLKSYRRLPVFLFITALFSLCFVAFYYWAGGHELVVPKFNYLLSLL